MNDRNARVNTLDPTVFGRIRCLLRLFVNNCWMAVYHYRKRNNNILHTESRQLQRSSIKIRSAIPSGLHWDWRTHIEQLSSIPVRNIRGNGMFHSDICRVEWETNTAGEHGEHEEGHTASCGLQKRITNTTQQIKDESYFRCPRLHLGQRERRPRNLPSTTLASNCRLLPPDD